MLPSDPDRLPDDLQDVARLLRDNRPEASALELDAVKRRVRNHAVRPSSPKSTTSMKSRIAMTAMLVSGLMMSGTGAGLAVSGLDAVDNASSAQYPVATPPPPPPPPLSTPPAPTPPPANDVLPTSDRSEPTCDENGDGVISPSEAAKQGCGEVASETDAGREPSAPVNEAGPAPREQAAQPTRQVAASGDDELPFTGFAAIPILVGGVALLGGGLVLRKRTA